MSSAPASVSRRIHGDGEPCGTPALLPPGGAWGSRESSPKGRSGSPESVYSDAVAGTCSHSEQSRAALRSASVRGEPSARQLDLLDTKEALPIGCVPQTVVQRAPRVLFAQVNVDRFWIASLDEGIQAHERDARAETPRVLDAAPNIPCRTRGGDLLERRPECSRQPHGVARLLRVEVSIRGVRGLPIAGMHTRSVGLAHVAEQARGSPRLSCRISRAANPEAEGRR